MPLLLVDLDDTLVDRNATFARWTDAHPHFRFLHRLPDRWQLHRLVSRLDEAWLQAGTSECKNWITAAGMLDGCGLRAELVDQVACYRSPAGTGTGTGFVGWR